jgi:hypothetical protein
VSTQRQSMNKVDATNGAFSGADFQGRWIALGERLERVWAAVPEPLARSAVVGCQLAFWSEDAELTVTASRDGELVG